ncbi:MAG TPA: HAMP domain-containing sensor histidine kinase [Gaiellaceae bacterium]|nr:HAMP domain-containing sensor histidine kinase [Gaiellaceae bacterium]
MEIAPEAVEVEPGRSAPRFAWAADNPVVRAIGRVPAPLGAKLVAAFSLIAALLAVGYAVAFVGLRQSNSRGEQLRGLQQRTAYEQLLLSDATQLKLAVDRVYHLAAPSQAITDAYGLTIAAASGALCNDAGGGSVACVGLPRKGLKLKAIDPTLARQVTASTAAFSLLAPGSPYSAPAVASAERIATSIVAKLTALANRTRVRADALVAQNHRSYSSSQNLLVGVGAGTIVLVLLLGLLLSSSVIWPLRRTEARLDEIAGGEFTGRLEVGNRDEIGSLAAKVNRMSDQLEHAYRELETASTHKSDFLATMSHELRTPLNAIIGFSEVLQEQMFGELNERQLAYVNDVLEAGRHLLSLINDVLDLAKIEAGRLELELSEFAISQVLGSAVSIHSERAGRAGIAVGLRADSEEITVTADERRVRQVVFNLVSNAVKFTPPDGRVDIAARAENGTVEVTVSDTGPGIAAEDLETIFEEFEQSATGKQAEGTGLGLPLSRKLVELHGGRLWAESEVGRGSTFRFTIPVQGPVRQEVP